MAKRIDNFHQKPKRQDVNMSMPAVSGRSCTRDGISMVTPHNRPLKLVIAGSRVHAAIVLILHGFGMLAALLSPRPGTMSTLVIAICGAWWGLHGMDDSRVGAGNSRLVVFSNGQIRLESACKDAIGGALEGQQWCTRHIAFLRVAVQGRARHLLVLAYQQQHADDYRCLLMWLRQGIGGDTK